MFVGDEAFVEKMADKAHRASAEVPRKQRAIKPLTAYARDCGTRDEAIAAAYASGGYTLKDIGKHFSLHYATVSRIDRRDVHQNKA